MPFVLRIWLAMLTCQLTHVSTAQDHLNAERSYVIMWLMKNAQFISMDTTTKADIHVRMIVQPVEQYYHFSDTLFSPYCDSISYGYNCGPCMDSHLAELLNDQWYHVGNERYVHLKNWTSRHQDNGQVTFYMKTISVERSPANEICGHLMLHATPLTKTERRLMRRKAKGHQEQSLPHE